MTSGKRHHKEKFARKKEEKPEEPETPRYRDRAKERREDQNPDYEATELGSFHAVAPPGAVDIRAAEAQKISIEKSKYLGGDVEHTHLVKGLDYALLNKVRSEIGKGDAGDDADDKSRQSKEDQQVSFRTATGKSVYQRIVKPQTIMKTNEMFLPGRMSFIYNTEVTIMIFQPHCREVKLIALSLRKWLLSVLMALCSTALLKLCHIFALALLERFSRRKRKTKNGYDAVQAQAYASAYPGGEWQEYPYAEQIPYPDQYLQQTYEMQAGAEVPQDPHFMTQEEKDRGLGSVFKRDDQRLQQLREKDAREKDPNFVSESYSECYPGYQEYNREVVDSDDEDDLSKMDMGGRAKGRLHRWDFETEEDWAKYNEQKEAMPKAAFQFGVKMQDGRKTRKQNKDQKLTNELHKINKILARKKMDKDGGGGDDDGGHHDDDIQAGKKQRL
ncbi:Suppressor of mec-8 and unc-52 protein homolog 2 [Linum grandiflorum]